MGLAVVECLLVDAALDGAQHGPQVLGSLGRASRVRQLGPPAGPARVSSPLRQRAPVHPGRVARLF